MGSSSGGCRFNVCFNALANKQTKKRFNYATRAGAHSTKKTKKNIPRSSFGVNMGGIDEENHEESEDRARCTEHLENQYRESEFIKFRYPTYDFKTVFCLTTNEKTHPRVKYNL